MQRTMSRTYQELAGGEKNVVWLCFIRTVSHTVRTISTAGEMLTNRITVIYSLQGAKEKKVDVRTESKKLKICALVAISVPD